MHFQESNTSGKYRITLFLIFLFPFSEISFSYFPLKDTEWVNWSNKKFNELLPLCVCKSHSPISGTKCRSVNNLSPSDHRPGMHLRIDQLNPKPTVLHKCSTSRPCTNKAALNQLPLLHRGCIDHRRLQFRSPCHQDLWVLLCMLPLHWLWTRA